MQLLVVRISSILNLVLKMLLKNYWINLKYLAHEYELDE
jgi:hypothetical protein